MKYCCWDEVVPRRRQVKAESLALFQRWATPIDAWIAYSKP